MKSFSLNIPVVTWGTGLDTRDESSINMIIKGFENNIRLNTNIQNTNTVISNAKLASARGLITKYTVGNEKLEVIGDPGIIFGRLADSYPLIEEISDFIGEDDKIILINWGTSFNNIAGKDEKKLESEIENAVNELLKSGYKIIIYPIWTNDIGKCIELSDKFKSINVRCIKKVYDAYGIAALIKRSHFTVNLKLHANILSMSLGKPFISLGYGLKCYDFCQSTGSEELNIFTHELTCEKILDKADYIEVNYLDIIERFKFYTEKYYVLQFEFARRILNILDGNYISTTRKSTVKLKKLGKNCEIFYDNIFVDEQNIEIGDNVYIGFGGYYIGSGGIKIGSGTIIAHKVEILTRNHNYDSSDLKSIPYDGRYVLKPVTIGENCWIGSHVCILPGVTIGEGSVIGMGSVVSRDVPNYSVVAGNPSKLCKVRDKDTYERLKKENKIYLKIKNL
jgi:maltose O-acetyltransferase